METEFEEKWNGGDVFRAKPTINMDVDSWDDQLIMNLYYESLETHTTNGSKKRRSSPYEIKHYAVKAHKGKVVPAGEPGEWEPVDISPPVEESQSSIVESCPVDSTDVGQANAIPSSDDKKIDVDSFQGSKGHEPYMPHDLLQTTMNEMLVSWYQTGYYTGRYEAMKEICNALSRGDMKYPSVTATLPPPK